MDSHLKIMTGKRLEIGPTTNVPSQQLVFLPSEQKIIAARNEGVFLKEMSDKDLVLLAGLLMDRAKIRLNHSTDYVDKSEMQLMIAKDLKAFPGLTDKEIWNAFTMGLNGDFLKEKDKDPVISFSATNLVRWIKAYIETVKAPVMKKVAQLEQQKIDKPEPSLAEQNAMLLAGLYAHIEKMKADPTYTFIDYGNAYHTFLTEIGIKLATKEQRWKIYQEETQNIKLKFSEINDKVAKRQWMEMIEQNAIRDSENAVEKMVIIACKMRVILNWIRECLEFDIEPKEIIEEKLSII